jgi:putative SOS response-associated peptidase YedK
MCGKFTAMYSWREIHTFSQPLGTRTAVGAAADSNDTVVTYRPVDLLPVIIWDREAKQRRIVPMQWGFPHRSNPKRPDPIHARSETVDSKDAFKRAFHDGQRGIVVFRTFNEGKEIPPAKSGGKPKTEQWTIDPGDGIPRGFAFVWRQFEPLGLPTILAAVMCTVPANAMIRRTIMEHERDPRMPAILDPGGRAAGEP